MILWPTGATVADEPDDLLQAVLERPDDDEPRRDYARWCARQESRQLRDRAEFIDLQLRLARSTHDPLHPPTRDWALESFLLAEHRRDWTVRSPPSCVTSASAFCSSKQYSLIALPY